VRSGDVDIALASGVEVMSRVPIGSSGNPKWGLGIPYSDGFVDHYERTSQFEAAERIADRWSVTREDADRFGLSSQRRAQAAWAEDRFAGQYIEIAVAELDEDGRPTGESRVVARDEGLRETTLEKLAALKPVGRENGVHTAGNSSQISDGAAAVLMMTARKAAELGLKARARIVDSVLVGTDPTLMLTGPIDATRKLLARTGLALDDIDLFEVNEAFASVVIAWSKEIGADLDKTNPNGGGIALGHPLGGTGCILVTKALYELDRTSSQFALVSMCCGGGLATGTVIERLD
jgi:acetyl-CoA C-acetyltransferase